MVIIPHAQLRSIPANLSLWLGSQDSYSTEAGILRI